MVFKKEVVEEKFTVKDQVPVGAGTQGIDTSITGPRVLAIVDDSKKSKLMLAELKERKVNVVSEVKVDFKDIVKAVNDTIKSETSKNNEYQVVYLPVTNEDYNKRAAEFTELRSKTLIPINLYFQDRNDVDIANKAFTRKIE